MHWILLLCFCVIGLVCVGCLCFNYCCAPTAASGSQNNGDYQPVSRTENIDLDISVSDQSN
jgi:hypothetical protein